MNRVLSAGLVISLMGCSSLPFGVAQNETPRWDPAATRPVLTHEWTAGFVHPDDWKVDTVRIFGDGRWEAQRTFSRDTNKPPVMVASGSLSVQALEVMLGTVFVREGGKRFLDLPEYVPSGVTDMPITRIAVAIENASHSVSVDQVKPPAFTRVQQAIASQTIAVPFPD